MFTLRIYTMMRNVDLPSELLTSMAMPPHSNVPEAEQTELEIIWAQNIDNVTKLRRYKKTAVFLFAWKGTDLREVESEISDLSEVFKTDYNFEIVQRFVEQEGAPQAQINRFLAEFVHLYDEEGTLLIVYYAGHGNVEAGREEFELLRNTTEATRALADWRKSNAIGWNSAESILRTTYADVFAIFDCCDAGYLGLRRGPIRFQYLGACQPGEITNVPGENSFTRALIWALKELKKEECFDARKLQTTIRSAPGFPENQWPTLTDCLNPIVDPIVIAPTPRWPLHEILSSPHTRTTAQPSEFLDLRFHFSGVLDNEAVQKTAKLLNPILNHNELSMSRIDFLQKSSNHREMMVIKYFQEGAEQKRRLHNLVRDYGLMWLDKSRKKKSAPQQLSISHDEVTSPRSGNRSASPQPLSASEDEILTPRSANGNARYEGIIIKEGETVQVHIQDITDSASNCGETTDPTEGGQSSVISNRKRKYEAGANANEEAQKKLKVLCES